MSPGLATDAPSVQLARATDRRCHVRHIPTPGERLNQLELLPLHAMTGDERQIWSVEDLGREFDDPARIIDAVRALQTAGLIHQTSDGYVFATRAAVRLIEIVGKVA